MSRQKLRLVVRNRLRLILKIFQKRLILGFLKNYIKEDMKSILGLFKRNEFGLIRAYLSAYTSLLFSLPDILKKRKKLKKRELLKKNEVVIMAKSPLFYSCMNEKDQPQINARTVFGCYRWELLKMDRGG